PGVVAPAEPIAGERSGVLLWRSQVIALGNAKSGGVGTQGRVGVRAEPRLIAKLKSEPETELLRVFQERIEPFNVDLQIRRKLKQNQTEPSGLSDGSNRTPETLQSFSAIFQPQDVRDALRGLERETKILAGFSKPGLDRGCRRQAAKGIVHLDGVKPGSIIGQQLFRGSGRGIKVRFPAWISPAGGSGINSVLSVAGH